MTVPEAVMVTNASDVLQDYDHVFELFTRMCRFDKVSEDAGLKMNSKHTIVQPWPMEVKKNAS